MKRALGVWWHQQLVGQLTQDDHGELGFVYGPEWLADPEAPSLSASLPKQVEPFNRKACRPFFAGLLPEEDQRETVARVLGVSTANDFSLLDCLGGEVAGAIELLPIGQEPAASPDAYAPTCLDKNALVSLLNDLPHRPFLAGERGLRLSLAGAQTKLPVVLVDNAVALPGPGQPTTHILKPPIERFPGTTENEAFVMRLAEAVGLDVARVEPRSVGGKSFLLVARYDRVVNADGGVERIHQEDFCQAIGIPPERKYASESGPTFAACFDLLRQVSAVPARDVLKLLDAAIFNVVVGNADAHGKNFSILYTHEGPRFAPLYDLLSTSFYPELSARLAMKIGRRSTLGELDATGWERFASDAGLGKPLVWKRVREMAAKVEAALGSVVADLSASELDTATVQSLAASIGARTGPCATSLAK